MPLLGRWIIANVGLGIQVRSMTGSKAEAPEGITPVVPCNDEAIDRSVRAIVEDFPGIPADTAVALAESVFRAAGETT